MAANFSHVWLGGTHRIDFTDTSTVVTPPIVDWLWDFGDGFGTSTDQNPSYVYPASGDYNVTLTVTDSAAASLSVTLPVTVFRIVDPNWASYPRHSDVVSPTSCGLIPTGAPIYFFGANYLGPDYLWTFNAGEELPDTEYRAVRSFKTAGTKTVRYTRTKPEGTEFVDHTFTIVDPEFFTRDFSVDYFPEEPQKKSLVSAGPVFWDGLIWMIMSPKILATSGAYIKGYNVADGSEAVSILLPSGRSYAGISWNRIKYNAGYLWFVANDQYLYRITATTHVLSVFDVGGTSYWLKSLAWTAQNELWAFGMGAGVTSDNNQPHTTVFQLDPDTADILYSVDVGWRAEPKAETMLPLPRTIGDYDWLAFMNAGPVFQGGSVYNSMMLFDPVSKGMDQFGVIGLANLIFHDPIEPHFWQFSPYDGNSPYCANDYSNIRGPAFSVVANTGCGSLIYSCQPVDSQNYLIFGRDRGVNLQTLNAGQTLPISGHGFVGLFNSKLKQFVWRIWDKCWVEFAPVELVLSTIAATSSAVAGPLEIQYLLLGDLAALSSVPDVSMEMQQLLFGDSTVVSSVPDAVLDAIP